MACPDCGTLVGDIRFVTSVETHGLDCGPFETFHEEFVVCRLCGGRFDLCDWDATPEEACSSPDGENFADRDCASSHLPSTSRGAQPASPRGVVDGESADSRQGYGLTAAKICFIKKPPPPAAAAALLVI